jgi:hypothetical protein
MRRLTKITKLPGVLAVFVVASALFAATINRPAAAIDCNSGGAYGLSLQTAPERLSFHAGQEITRHVQVKNNGCEPIVFRVEATPFAPASDYSNNFDTESRWTQISRYITFPETEFTLDVGEVTQVQFTINVPDESQIAAGGQYAAIAFVGERQSVGGVTMIPRVMYQVIGRMDGEIVPGAKILSQHIPAYSRRNTVVTAYKVQNNGNVDFQAYGKLLVKSFFGRVVYETPEKQRVSVFAFPETTPPDKEVKWEDARIGLFWVTQSVEIDGQATDKTRLVFVAPLWLLVVALVGLSALIFLVTFNLVRARIRNKKVGLARRD